MNKYFLRKKPSSHDNGLLSGKRGRPNSSDYLSFDRTLGAASDTDDGVAFVFHGSVDGDENCCLPAETFHLRDRSSTGVGDAATKQTFLEKKLCVDDSLASIALRYGCTVAELKRANNLLTDQEIHGLRTIKVPVKPYSLLTEQIENEIGISVCGGGQNDELDAMDSNVRTLSIGSSIFPNDSASFLSAMDEDLERIRLTTSLYKSSLEEVTEQLTCKRFHPLAEQCRPQERSRHFGRFVIIWIIVITIVIPLIIFLCLELQKNSST